MWVRSQDRKILTEIHDVEIDSGFKVWGSGSLIGEYSTEEKALKVLGQIHNAISDRVVINGKLYSSPRGINKSRTTANEGDVIYIMPLDEEVEV